MKPLKTLLTSAPKVQANVDGKIMFTSDKLEVIHLTLVPKQRIDPHVMPHDVLFYVLEGSGVLHCGGDLIEGTPNSTIFVPVGNSRGWENTGDVPLKLLVIKDLG